MRYAEAEVVSQLVAWVQNEADLDDLAAMYSEHRADEIVVVVAGPNGPASAAHVNGKPYQEEDE